MLLAGAYWEYLALERSKWARHLQAVKSTYDAEQPPAPGYALEIVFASVLELETRARDEINHSSGKKDLSWLSKSLDTRGSVDGNTTDVISTAHNFSRVDPDAYFESEIPGGLSDAAGTADGPGRPVEDGQCAVSHGLHPPTLETLYLCVHSFVICVQKNLRDSQLMRGTWRSSQQG